MKLNFRKISAIASSVLLTGMTMGVAAAAAFPAPFKDAGASGTAVVYGSGADPMDHTASTSIATYLASQMPSTTSTIIGGESYKFEKDTDKLNIRDNLTTMKPVSIKVAELPTILADGTYSNAENTEYDYEQKIDLSTQLQYKYFAESNYNSKEPSLGIFVSKSSHVLNYTLDFKTSAEDDTGTSNWEDFENTEIQLLGKKYDIVDAKNSTRPELTLMSGSEKDILGFGESQTYTVEGKTYDVAVTYVDSDECKFTVNGQSTTKLMKGQTDKPIAGDDTEIGVTEVDYSTGAVTEIMNCEFYIGADKIVIDNTKEVAINDEDVDKLYGYIDVTYSSGKVKLDQIVLQWTADKDLFITDGSSISLPGFGSVMLSSTGLTTPNDGEEIQVRGKSNDEVELTVTLDSGETTITLLGSNGTGGFDAIGGADNGEGLATAAGTSAELIYNITSGASGDQYFVVTYYDGSQEGTSYLVEVYDSDDANGVDFKDVVSGGSLNTDIKNATAFTIGDATITLNKFIEDEWVNMTAGSNTYFDRLVTAEGMIIYLPVDGSVSGGAVSPYLNLTLLPTSYIIRMDEEDKDGTLGGGVDINVTVSHTASHNVEAKIASATEGSFSGADMFESPTDDNYYTAYAASDLGTKVIYDSDPDEDTVDVTYYGSQIYGNFFIAEAGASSTGASAGSMVFMDTEQSDWSNKNVILVGGTCINSATAKALGVAMGTCASAFTTATGVGAGQYLIQSVAGSNNGVVASGKIALVVAGYSASDTTAAASYLTNNAADVDTTAGLKGVGIVGTTGTITFAQA